MARQKFIERKFALTDERQRANALALIPNLPLDAAKPLEVVIREQVKGRKLSQQALMFAGPLEDIAKQAWLNGRQFSAEVWHEFMKREFLPEEFDAELCKEGYIKWDFDPAGNRVMVGSTVQLTIRGMAQHITQVEAFGASLGVMFHASPNQGK